MKKNTLFIGFIVIILSLVTTGCLDMFTAEDKTIIYESHPTSILYTLSYGYKINCTGSGDYELSYNCDEPSILSGSVLSIFSQDSSYTIKNMPTFNTIRSWNIKSDVSKEYDLGITTTISCNSYLVSDLNGKNALTILEIKNLYPDIITKYTKAQSNETIVFIDPNDPDVQEVAFDILNQTSSENSFIVAKELFKWLKQNIEYQTHLGSNHVQPAIVTLRYQTGDCDDISFLYISLCRSIDIPARFIRGFLIEQTMATPHAWVEVFVGGNIGNMGWIPIECAGISENINTEIHQNFGVESADHLRLFLDDGSDESLNTSISDLSYKTYESRKIQVKSYTEIIDYSILKSNQLVIDENGNRAYK